MFKIFKFLSLFSFIVITMSSCSDFRYITKHFNTTKIINKEYLTELASNTEITFKADSTVERKTYSKDKVLIACEVFSDSVCNTQIGKSQYWYDSKEVKTIANYDNNGNLDGEIFTYYKNGKIKRKDLYKKGKLLIGQCFAQNGDSIKYVPFISEATIKLEKLPFHISYPENLRKQNIEEKMVFWVFVSENGDLVKVLYDNAHSPEFIEEAVKIIISTKYNPKTIESENCAGWLKLPINFQLR